MNNLEKWEDIRKNMLEIEGIKDFNKVKCISDKIQEIFLEDDCSIIEVEKILDILNQQLIYAKKLILREPLKSVLKYKGD